MPRARLKVLTVDRIESHAWETRAVECRTGDTTRVMDACLRDLDGARTVREIRAVRKAVAGRFAAVEADRGKVPLKIGLVGEATVLRNKFLNHNIEETLGSMGVQVRNFFLLGEESTSSCGSSASAGGASAG